MELSDRIVYVCSLCLRQYDLMEDLRGHMMFFHDYQPVKPAKRQHACGSKAKSLDSQDLITSASSPPGPAELQPLPFKDFRLVLRANMRVPCTESSACIYKFENVHKLAMHVKCHKGDSFNCSECGLDFPNWRRCSAHLWKTHQIDVNLLQCPVLGCVYKSTFSAIVWRHMRVHKKWRARVLRSEQLRRRVLQKAQQQLATTADGEMPSSQAQPAKKNKYYAEKTCDICQRKFVSGKTLSKHVQTVHNKIKPFICNVCGKKTARKASLIIHMRQHTGEKPLKCGHCKFSTRDPSSLYKHSQRHSKQVTAAGATASALITERD